MDSDDKKRVRQVRVDMDLWKTFGEAAEAAGTDRSKLLVAFMRRYVAAMSVRPDPIPRTADTDQAIDPGHSPM
jgi:hypothetical protein